MRETNQMLDYISDHDYRSDGIRDMSINQALEAGFQFDFEIGELIGWAGSTKDLTIPTSIAGVEVRGIAESAFQGKDLASVLIPDTVAVIREKAFADNPLKYVSMEEGLVTIHPTAFSNTKISAVRIPSTVLSLERDTFYEGSPSAQDMKGRL